MSYLTRTGLVRGLLGMVTHSQSAVMAAQALDALLKDGKIITMERAAKKLGYTRMAVWRIVQRGDMTNIRIGRTRFVLASEVEEYRKELDGA